MSKAKIKAIKNGPFKVTGVNILKRANDHTLETEEEMYLCRCGGSNNKPYCDGTHKSNHFNGEHSGAHIEGETLAYVGDKIIIYDNRSVCSHRGYCTSELPSVFKETEPWIDPNGDTVAKIIALCEKCPSGALSYALPREDKHQGGNSDTPTVRLSEKHFGYHGPYDVSGPIELDGQVEKSPELKNKMTLCRCGHSKNKPYCSGEHYYVQFIDDKND